MLILRLLGGLVLETGDIPAGRASQKRRLALLAVLASRPGVPISRDKLLALFWPEVVTEEARHRLSAALYDLRRALGDQVIVARGDEVFVPDGVIDCDTVQFDAAVHAGDWHLATQLYRGPFLDGVHMEDAPEFDEWVEQRRTQFARSFSRSLEEWARESTARGDSASAVDAWARLAGTDPLNDRLALGLMKAFEAAGNRAGALRHAAQHEERLRNDLGVEPDQSVRKFAASLLVEPRELSRDLSPPVRSADAPAVIAAAPPVNVPLGPLASGLWPRGAWLTRAAIVVGLLVAPFALRSMFALPDESGGAPRALVAFNEGEAHLQSGRFDLALAAFEHAVQLDSSYAPAHFQLAVATLWADQPGDRINARVHEAVVRRDRLDEHTRILLDGFIAWRQGAWHEAENMYRRALTMSPASLQARHDLGEVLFHYNAPQGRSIDEARIEFERVLAGNPRHYGALWHLAQIAARDGRRDDVAQLTDRLLALEPDSIRALEVQVLRAAALKDAATLDRIVERLQDADESLLFGIGWRLAVFGRNFDAADRVFGILTAARRGPQAHALGHSQRLYLALARGNNASANAQFAALGSLRDAGVPLGWLTLLAASVPDGPVGMPQVQALRDSLARIMSADPSLATLALHRRWELLTTLGAASAMLGDSTVAELIARQIERLPLSETDTVTRSDVNTGRAATIRALQARQAGRPHEVLRWTERSLIYRWFGNALTDPIAGYGLERYMRAEALLAVGRLDEADAWFASIGDHDPSDLVFLPASLRHRAQIASDRGDRTAMLRFQTHLGELRSVTP